METVLPTEQSLLPPAPVRTSLLSSLRKKFAHILSFSTSDSTPAYFSDATSPRPSTTRNGRNFNFKNNKFLFIPAVLAILFALLILVNAKKGASPSNGIFGAQKLGTGAPKYQMTLNKKFLFPIRDGSGKEVTKIAYFIQDAQLRDQIIIKGRPANAVEGRQFLILDLKITNDYNKTIQLNTRDYVRLTVNGSSEKLAFDIHNDPVEVLANSTKPTRLAIAINTSDKDITLLVGEVNGTKQTIKLKLK